MFDFTTSMPTPRPETLVMVSAVESAGQKDQPLYLRIEHTGRLLWLQQPPLQRFVLYFLEIDAGSIVRYFDVDRASLLEGAQQDGSMRTLPVGDPDLR